MVTEPTEKLYCSFCNKSNKEVATLVAGPLTYICDECIRLAAQRINFPAEEIHIAVDRLIEALRDEGPRSVTITQSLLVQLALGKPVTMGGVMLIPSDDFIDNFVWHKP